MKKFQSMTTPTAKAGQYSGSDCGCYFQWQGEVAKESEQKGSVHDIKRYE